MKYKITNLILWSLLALLAAQVPKTAANQEISDVELSSVGKPILHKKITIPASLLSDGFGGDIRMGDLTGNGQVEFIVYRSEDVVNGISGGSKPVFMAAFNQAGEVLWKQGSGGLQPTRPGAVAIFDIDNDGENEIINFWKDKSISSAEESMANVVLQIRNAKTGAVEKETAPKALTTIKVIDKAGFPHMRILAANLRGKPTNQDFIIKVGHRVMAFDENLESLWTYNIPMDFISRPHHASYVPAVGDMNGDGKTEVNGGHFILNPDNGVPIWKAQIGQHNDVALIQEWDNGKIRAFASGYGHVLSMTGDILINLGNKIVPHGQELRVGDFLPDEPGLEMIIRYDGHKTKVITVNNAGEVKYTWKLNSSPNETGMEAVYWNGPDGTDLLYNGGELWNGDGSKHSDLPELPSPIGDTKMGWYHCIPADVTGDKREEVVLYNPWDKHIYIYTPFPLDESAFEGYNPGPRQYNVRLMD